MCYNLVWKYFPWKNKGGPKMNAFLKRLVCGGSILAMLLAGCAAPLHRTDREELPVFTKEPTVSAEEPVCHELLR